MEKKTGTENTGSFRSVKEKEVFDYMHKNLHGLEKEYFKDYGNILSQDFAKNLFEVLGYNKLKPEGSSDYSRAGWKFVNYLYDNQLAKKRGQGNNAVLITGGGTGAGKTTTALQISEEFDFPIINDTNIFYMDRTKLQIDKALEYGFSPQILFIYRDPVEAYTNGVLKRIRSSGHLVTIENHVKITNQVRENINLIADAYRNGLEIFIIDNADEIDDGNESLKISREELNRKQYYTGELENILKYEARKMFKEGRIPEEILRGAEFKF
jgi:hypothetical protein